MSPSQEYVTESAGEKYERKLRENPILIGGLIGLVSSLVYGTYKYNNRGTMSRSAFLMQLRVSSQGMVVGALSIGMLWETGKLVHRLYNDPS